MQITISKKFIIGLLTFCFAVAGIGMALAAPNSKGDSPPAVVGPTPVSGMPITAQVRFVGVLPDGTKDLTRSLGYVVSSKVGDCISGCYEVLFSTNVTGCAYLATIARNDNQSEPGPGEITTVGRVGNVKGVFISTYDSNGARADRGFHLAVIC